VQHTKKDAKALRTGIDSLGITRLKEEHICKIIDFLPKTVDELRYVLQGYNITLPKKDSEQIVSEVKKVV
jgi:DNA-directed RNA polymerase subunit F